MKKLLLAAMAAASLGSAALPLAASADVLVVRTAPPPMRDEVVPAAREGYVWTPGYWRYNGHRYVWTHGKYVRERHGYYWREPAWKENNGRWEFTRGNWARGDRDRDGVPNRYDDHPNDPTRR
ncbi:YXWGXW repeat-containing protein [Pseudoduganella sp. RAF53_2]|jgi:hypothetical protein|uniref:YXWGXW repeat-containing protein n=1 Tax=unclassified Pseudoduganella TaxID=2637179 RepID=UPI003F9B7FB1